MTDDGSIGAVATRTRELLAEILCVDPQDIRDDVALFDADADLDGLELDSLDSLKLAVALAEEYDLDPAVEIDYARVRTVREIAEYIYGLLNTGGGP